MHKIESEDDDNYKIMNLNSRGTVENEKIINIIVISLKF